MGTVGRELVGEIISSFCRMRTASSTRPYICIKIKVRVHAAFVRRAMATGTAVYDQALDHVN